jgi:hypothetical protein
MRYRQGRFSFGIQNSTEARILRYIKQQKEATRTDVLHLKQGCDLAAKN